MFAPCIDHKFCVDEPYKRMLEGKWAKVPVLSGNTNDEFKSFVPASDLEEFKAKAVEIFGDKADKFLSFKESTEKGPMGFATVSGIEASVKGAAEANIKNGTGDLFYYYRFNPDIPGDNAGTFHSVDLWFFFDNLNKCWRPFVGRHYDLARQISTYWANFIKTGNPNGVDIDGTKLPEWKPYGTDRNEMEFTKEGPVAKKDTSEYVDFIKNVIVEKAK
ncbi:MAG: carboxylesterase family protein, partial [Lachnospiraceae bacterium]|nr:carboxylesterase family protein [Lachnospiraceae bacterium]